MGRLSNWNAPLLKMTNSSSILGDTKSGAYLEYSECETRNLNMPRKPPKDSFDKSRDLPDNIGDCHNLIAELFSRIAELNVIWWCFLGLK
jgi:hypothetical protein